MLFQTILLVLSPCLAWAFLVPRVVIVSNSPTVTTKSSSSQPGCCWMAAGPNRGKKANKPSVNRSRALDRRPINREGQGQVRKRENVKVERERRNDRPAEQPRDDADDSRNVRNWFPDNLHNGDEIDVRIVKVMDKYALCRPLDYPYLRGKISVTEMDEYDDGFDAHDYVKERLIYRAFVLKLMPPDRVLFSLRRVRRVLRDDFQPFTICLFNIPYDLTENEIKALMDGEVLDVTLFGESPEDRADVRSYGFVTFLHEADGVAALRKWSVTKMPCTIRDRTHYYTVRAKKANRQDYRERLQAKLDDKYYDKLERWNETPNERRGRIMADRDLLEIIPWYIYDRDNAEFYDRVGYLPREDIKYSIKNNPRTYR